MAKLKRSPTALAYEALGLFPGLSGNAHRVAALLVRHRFNKTGRCDPSVGRMAKMLEIDPATVKRATRELERAGLFTKAVHGGYSNRNQYDPNWDFIYRYIADWKESMRTGEPPPLPGAELRPEPAQNCAKDGCNTAPQTHRDNPKKKTHEETGADNPDIHGPSRPDASGSGKEEDSRTEKDQELQATMRPRTTKRSIAAEQAAYKRWMDDFRKHIHQQGGDWECMAELYNLITEAMEKAATQAELKKRGEGLRYILRAIDGSYQE